MIKKIRLAWAAGLIDGEGCIGIDYKRKPLQCRHPSYRLRLRVGMTHKQTVFRLKNIFNVGTISKRIMANKRYKPQYVWSINGREARDILVELLPLLCTKRRDAKIGIEFRNFMDTVVVPGRGAYSSRIIKKQHSYYLKLRKTYGNYKLSGRSK